MIPATVAGLIKVSLNVVQATAAGALGLLKGLQIAQGTGPARGVYSRFVGLFRSQNPGSTVQQANEGYRAAQYWASAGDVYTAFPPDMPLDARLAREIEGKGDFINRYARYLYNVEAIVTDPTTGTGRTYNFWVRDQGILSPEDLYGNIQGDLATVVGESPPVAGEKDTSHYNITYRVADFARYI